MYQNVSFRALASSPIRKDKVFAKKEAPCPYKALLLELDVGFEPTTS